jgi:hypothetical protein
MSFLAFYFLTYTLFSTYSIFNGYSWDEWVPSDRLLKYTEENIRKQQDLMKNQTVDKTIRTGRAAQNNPKGSNG